LILPLCFSKKEVVRRKHQVKGIVGEDASEEEDASGIRMSSLGG
jgi:hypothetical protein